MIASVSELLFLNISAPQKGPGLLGEVTDLKSQGKYRVSDDTLWESKEVLRPVGNC